MIIKTYGNIIYEIYRENSKKIISPYTIEGYMKTFEEIIISHLQK